MFKINNTTKKGLKISFTIALIVGSFLFGGHIVQEVVKKGLTASCHNEEVILVEEHNDHLDVFGCFYLGEQSLGNEPVIKKNNEA